jgi:isoleucyl-tRNA synthetase
MYEPVKKKPDFPVLEQRILELWRETCAFDLLREQNRGGPRWSFLDGPITANNPMGVHHAWGRSLKDMYQRYHAMCGQELRFQNGFDCQGLWVEVEVEKEHGFATKQDIEAYGMDRFVEDCKARVLKYSAIQTEQSVRLGYWMDWDHSYFTMSDENNFTIWSFLKKCHERGHVHKGLDSMPWCPRCGVGLSEMEMHEGYRWVEDLSVFLRFPIRGRDQEALLVWTTTPWTLTSNVAAAVHPDMSYYRVRQGEWVYYVGADNWQNERRIEVEEASEHGKKRRVVKLKTLAEMLEMSGPVEIEGTVQGKDLLGLAYDGPFDELAAQREQGGFPFTNLKLRDHCGASSHRVIAWDEVTGGEGTGIVHIAPGCGKEDFVLGGEEDLVAISPLDEGGRFLRSFDWLEGRHAHEVAEAIVDNLRDKGLLVGSERYPHRYAHCWRCGTAVLYRLVDEWFISMDWRDEIIGTVPKIRWIPDYGEQRELDWLRNMGDWMISKKRYWGLALPIWQCDHHTELDNGRRCQWFDVIGSRSELEERAIEGWESFDGHSPHRPWIDAVKIRCEACGGTASRIADVGNPWLDAGIVPYSTMGFSEDREYWERWFPPELVLECFPGQFRNWFYALLAMSTMMQEDRWADCRGGESAVVPPFRTLLGYALVLDEQGHEMHKSRGNAIEFNTAAQTIGAEVMRYIFAAQNPTTNLRFPDIRPGRRGDVIHRDQEVQRTLLTLWNCYSFYVTYAEVDGITPRMLEVAYEQRSELDRWVLSKLQSLIGFARECFEQYRVHLLMEAFERFLEELSNWYLRRSRRRFWKSENDSDKLAAYATLFEVLETLCRLLAPVLPFLAEEVYQNIVRSVDADAPVSVHLRPYPEVDTARVDRELAARIDVIVKYKNLGLSVRNQAGLKVRQPLAKIIVKPEGELEHAALELPGLRAQLLEELNIKELELVSSIEGLVETEVRPNFKTLGPKYGPLMKDIQAVLKGIEPRPIQLCLDRGESYILHLGATQVALSAEDLEVRSTAVEGLAFAMQGTSFVAIDTTVSDELRREGLARDFVRGVQSERKAIDLDVADRIRLRYHAHAEIDQAVREWSAYVGRETLAVEIAPDETLAQAATSFKVGGEPVVIAIERVDPKEILAP